MLSGGDRLPIIVALVRMFSQAIPLKSTIWPNTIKVVCMWNTAVHININVNKTETHAGVCWGQILQENAITVHNDGSWLKMWEILKIFNR